MTSTIQWQRGDIVLHEADSKKPYMLLVVEGEQFDDEMNVMRIATRYLNPLPNGPDVVLARPESLLDPAQFGINLETLMLLDLSYPGDRFRYQGKAVRRGSDSIPDPQ